jgi:Arc/MetJ family transcription regulator
MATNLALDDRLIEQAVRLGKHKSKKEAVTAALEAYVRQGKRAGLRNLIGAVDFHEDFNRRGRRGPLQQ